MLRQALASTHSFGSTPSAQFMKLFCTSSGPLDVLEVLQQQQYPVRQLTKREQSLFKAPKPALRKVDDHGFIYGIKPEMMKDAPEPVVRALSTRTAALPQLRAFRRSQLLSKFGTHEFDSGSSRVQTALMTERIQSLSSHLQRHRKDHDARRQMAILISRRQRLLRYMIRNDYENYRLVVDEALVRPLAVHPSKYSASSPKRPHKEIIAKNKRLKNRKGRGAKGH